MNINKFALYRLESVTLFAIFFFSLVLMIYLNQPGWIIVSWTTSALLQFHLMQIKCPNCNSKLMKRSSPKGLQSKWFMLFPSKCGACNKELFK